MSYGLSQSASLSVFGVGSPGKTGTAETHIDDPHAWFAGYAPAFQPEVVITVILEHAGEGSKQAAPLFRTMADAYFALRS